ncbi:MAG TPA: HAD-IIB family hydrolase, partial [Ktedonobacterales bacterium]
MNTSVTMAGVDATERRIRLVVSDIDGTLLGPSGVPTPRTSSALRRVRSAGVTVALATARRWTGGVPAAAALGIEGPLILYDGALVRSYPDGEVITHEAMDRDHVAEACRALAAGG